MTNQQQLSFDHPKTPEQANTEATSLKQEASKAFWNDAYKNEIKTTLQNMTPGEQTLMASAFKTIDDTGTASSHLPHVELTPLDSGITQVSFSRNVQMGEKFSVYIGQETEASKQKRLSENAAEVAKMLRDRKLKDATNRMAKECGESEEDWVSFMKQVSKLAPNQLQLLTPSDIAKLTPNERNHLAKQFCELDFCPVSGENLENNYYYATTQPNWFGLARTLPILFPHIYNLTDIACP